MQKSGEYLVKYGGKRVSNVRATITILPSVYQATKMKEINFISANITGYLQ